MVERQVYNEQSEQDIPDHNRPFGATTHHVQVECPNGSVLRFTAEGSDSIAQIRERTFGYIAGELGVEEEAINIARKYVVAIADPQDEENLQIVDDNATVDQIRNEGQVLNFQLIPQVAFGLEDDSTSIKDR